MQCVHSCDDAVVAASLSNREIKVFDRASLAPKVRVRSCVKGCLKIQCGAFLPY